jgi:hypothetical protein
MLLFASSIVGQQNLDLVTQVKRPKLDLPPSIRIPLLSVGRQFLGALAGELEQMGTGFQGAHAGAR